MLCGICLAVYSSTSNAVLLLHATIMIIVNKNGYKIHRKHLKDPLQSFNYQYALINKQCLIDHAFYKSCHKLRTIKI